MCYTYLIKCTINNKFYYGVRWGNKVPSSEDLWIKYFTSSKVIKNLINQYGKDVFLFKVRKVFTTKQEAIAWEETVLRRLKVLKSPDIWLNKCISKAIRYDIHPRKGIILSEQTKEKISKSNIGKPKFTDSQKSLMSLNRKGSLHWNHGNTWTDTIKQKNSNTNKNNWAKLKKDSKAMQIHIEKSIAKRVKTWLLENPMGEQFTITNLSKFCRDNNLQAPNLHSKGHSKGYKLIQRVSSL
jgi:hypothetical protein